MTDVRPDTKDWTWTLERRCPECGFTARDVPGGEVAGRVAAYTTPWAEVLRRHDVRDRPDEVTWSPLEYACHVRDVCRVFEERLTAMLEDDDPAFGSWDQDATAVTERYDEQDPAAVAAGLARTAERFAARYAAVGAEGWGRTGRRSDGSTFTVLTLGRYALHDLRHHLHDVGAAPA